MIKTLLKSIREYKKATIMTPVFVAIESVIEILIPTLMALLIDDGINKNDMNFVIFMGVVLLVCSGFSLWTAVLSAKNAAVASAGFAKNLRHDIFEKVQTFSFKNIDKFSTSSIITRLTTDVTNVQNAFQMLIRLAVRGPVLIISALLFSMRIDVGLSLIFVGVIPVLAFGLWFIITNAHPIFVRVFKKYDKLNNTVQENLHGIRVVKSYVREDHEEEKFEAISQEIYNNFTKAGKRLAFNMPLLQMCIYVCILLISWFGAQQIIVSGNDAAFGLTVGELTSLISYTMQILMSLMMLSTVLIMVIISRASVERIVEVINTESTLQNPENPIYEVKDGSVKFENVSFSYSKKADKLVLDNINLDIKSGQIIGILGGTGASKSSLVSLIPRLYDVADGSVLVGGEDVRAYDMAALRHQVAVVLQKNILFSGTIKENLRWGNKDATDDELKHACQLAQADGFVSAFPDGYDTHVEQGGTNLSGGQRQRLCIARALVKKPKILILDDSTSAVDVATDSAIRQAFRTEIPNTTKIIIAQRVSSIQDADQIVVLNEGKIVGVGTHDELLKTNEIYKEVYESQNRGGVLHG